MWRERVYTISPCLAPPSSLLGLFFYFLQGSAVITCSLSIPLVRLASLSSSCLSLLPSLYL